MVIESWMNMKQNFDVLKLIVSLMQIGKSVLESRKTFHLMTLDFSLYLILCTSNSGAAKMIIITEPLSGCHCIQYYGYWICNMPSHDKNICYRIIRNEPTPYALDNIVHIHYISVEVELVSVLLCLWLWLTETKQL